MYKIIGADRKEYGPVSGDQIRHWIVEGRVNAQTQIRAEGAQDWRALSSYPEFASSFGSSAPPPLAPPSPLFSPEEVAARDYNLDIGGCISRGWGLFQNNFGLLMSGVLIYAGIQVAFSIVGIIPIIGPLVSLASLVIMGPLQAGLFFLTLRTLRGERAEATEVFVGFRKCFGQLLGGMLIPALFVGLCMVPVGIAAVIMVLPSIINHTEPDSAKLLMLIPVFLLSFMAAIFLQVNWLFTLPLIIDKQMSFWPAMQLSWKMVRKHWWHVFGLVVLVALINLFGFCLCCVGALFTWPICIAALMYAYEDIFSRPAA
jgi:hypothetical protein